MEAGRDVVSATFIIPYPPGFPILVPGQVASPEIIEFIRRLDVKEIHVIPPGTRPSGLHRRGVGGRDRQTSNRPKVIANLNRERKQ